MLTARYIGSVNPHDTGLFQIDEVYHAAEAERRGLDTWLSTGSRT